MYIYVDWPLEKDFCQSSDFWAPNLPNHVIRKPKSTVLRPLFGNSLWWDLSHKCRFGWAPGNDVLSITGRDVGWVFKFQKAKDWQSRAKSKRMGVGGGPNLDLKASTLGKNMSGHLSPIQKGPGKEHLPLVVRNHTSQVRFFNSRGNKPPDV